MKRDRLIIILRLVLTEAAGDGLKSEILPRFPVFSKSQRMQHKMNIVRRSPYRIDNNNAVSFI